jgi:hypothetical protein
MNKTKTTQAGERTQGDLLEYFCTSMRGVTERGEATPMFEAEVLEAVMNKLWLADRLACVMKEWMDAEADCIYFETLMPSGLAESEDETVGDVVVALDGGAL